MTEDYSTYGTAQKPNTAVITRANGQKEYIKDHKVVATGTPIKQEQTQQNKEVLVAYENPEEQKSYFYRGVIPGYLVSSSQTPIVNENKVLIGYQDPNTKQSVSLEKQRELINVAKTQQQTTTTQQNTNIIKSNTKKPEEVFNTNNQKTFLDNPVFKKIIPQETELKGMALFFPLNYAKTIGERTHYAEIGAYSGFRENPGIFSKNLLIGGAIGGVVAGTEFIGSVTGTLPFTTTALEVGGLGITANYFGSMYIEGQSKPLKERYEFYGQKFSTEIIPFSIGYGAVEGAKQPLKNVIEVKQKQAFDYQMEKSYFKKVDPNFIFNRDLGGEAFYEYKWNELKTTTQTQLKPTYENVDYNFANQFQSQEGRAINIKERQTDLYNVIDPPKIPSKNFDFAVIHGGNLAEEIVYISPFNLVISSRYTNQMSGWKNDFIGSSIQTETNFNAIGKERTFITKNKFIPDLTKTPDLNTENLNVFTLPFNPLINSIRGETKLQTQFKSLFSYETFPLYYANTRSEIKVDFGAISQEKTKSQTQPENLVKYGASSLFGSSSGYSSLEQTQSITMPFAMASVSDFSISNPFARPKIKTNIKEKNPFFSPPVWELPNFTPRAVRVRSSPDFKLNFAPVKLDIIPFADLFSVNLTESLTGHKATHPKITKRSKREYSEFIRFGEQIFPTEEMRTGQIKLFKIDL
jgi:hypothetical protein